MRSAATSIAQHRRERVAFGLVFLVTLLIVAIPASAEAKLTVTTVSPGNGQTVSGSITWQVTVPTGNVDHVDFAVDGTVKWTEHVAPWLYNGVAGGLNTTALANGTHQLTAKAYSANGRRTGSSTVTVTVSNAAPAPSPPPPPPPPPSSYAPVSTTLPSISGTPTVGQTLTASTGTWSGSTPMTYSYGWNRCNSSGASCVPISGATSPTYILASGDAGWSMRVSVTATNSASSATATSGATGAVINAPSAPITSGSTRDVYPGQSILAAIDASAPGDTVFVHAGNYPKLILNNKTFAGGKVHIVGEPGTVIAGVLLQSVGGYSFENLTSSLPSTTSCCESGFYISGTSHDIDIVNDTIRGGWDGVKVYAAYPASASNIVVRDSDIASAGEDDFHIDGAQNMLIEHNYIHDPQDNADHNDGIQSQRSDGLTITRNTISFQSVAPYDGPNQGIILNEDCSLPNGLVTNSVISNNLIAHWNAGRPVELSGVNGVQVVNNTLVDDGPGQNYASITLNKRSGCNFDALNVAVWNNIADMVYVDAGTSQPSFCDDNLIRHPSSTSVCANTITADPRFVDTTSYALGPSSPARGVALTRAGTPTVDIDGAVRTTPLDLGARG